MRYSLKILFIISVFFYGIGFASADLIPTIHSTSTGGLWNSALTWEGGIIPTSSDIVEINGGVVIRENLVVNGLKLTASGVLSRQSCSSYCTGGYKITVNGDVENNGKIGLINTKYQNRFYIDVKGDVLNNGIVNHMYGFYLYGDVENTETSVWDNVRIYYRGENPTRNIIMSENFNPQIYLETNIEILGDFDYQNTLYLNNKELKLDGTKNLYIKQLEGGGIVSSLNGNGDGELLKVGTLKGGVVVNIENLEIRSWTNGFTGRQVKFSGSMQGTINVERLVLDGGSSIQTNVILNGDLELTSSGVLKRYGCSSYCTGPHLFTVNGNIENNGKIGTSSSNYNGNFYILAKGNIYNNGEISLFRGIYLYGDIENTEESLWQNVALYLRGENPIRNITISENFKPILHLETDIEILGDFNLDSNLYLNNHELKLDGTKNLYIKQLEGGGTVSSLNGNGDGESIKVGVIKGGAIVNIENLEVRSSTNGFTGRQVKFSGYMQGTINADKLTLDGGISIQNGLTINGDLELTNSGVISRGSCYSGCNWGNRYITVTGNVENNGNIGLLETTSVYQKKFILNINGNLINNGTISNNYGVYLYGSLDNINGTFPGPLYLKWEPIDSYTDYIISIGGVEESIVYPQYLVSNITKTGENLTWKVKGEGTIIDSDWTEEKCINKPGCIQTGNEPVPTPMNLQQWVQSPELEKVEIGTGSKVGKYQSGSGIILSADIANEIEESYRLAVEVYKYGTTTPIDLFNSKYFTGTTLETTIPYLGAGSYYWKASIEDKSGNASEWGNFGTDSMLETDYILYEGFEPYPYGYSFANSGPVDGLLKGGIKYFNWNTKSREKIDGEKWDIFYNAFDTGSLDTTEKLVDAFEVLGLNTNKVFEGGNCFGMSMSSVYQKNHPSFMEANFPEFSEQVGTGTIRHNIEKLSMNENGNWNDYNKNIETILSMQLYQYSKHYFDVGSDSPDNKTSSGTIDNYNIVRELENPENKDKTYIITFSGVDKDGVNVAHTVVYNKTEKVGNSYRIYFWDNNVSYPNIEINDINNYAYNQYIEIKSEIEWESQLYIDKGRKEFKNITLVDTEEIYNNGNKSAPIGQNELDIIYSLSGSSDMVVKDSEGRISGFSNGEILEEIPGVKIILPNNNSNIDITENRFKQIYLPQKQDLTVKVISKEEESYDLMIAGGDYYTKLENVETNSGQIDIYNITRENLQINFDDSKIGNYNLLVDNFHNNGTGTIYMDNVESKIELQQYIVSWTGVIDNSSEAIIYEVDTDNDGTFDESINLPPLFQDNIAPITNYNISGELNDNTTNSYIETVTIDLTSIDNEGGTGVNKIYYAIGTDTGSLVYVEYIEPIMINGVGNYRLNYYAKDLFGNIEVVKIVNFLLTEKQETYAGNISGYVYDDSNENGIRDDGEKFMAGWKICIDLNNNNDCEENNEPFNVTNNQGYYEFDSLETGTYKILEIPHKNWEITNPTIGYYIVNLNNGEIVTNNNFGNFKYKGNNKK